MEAKLHPGLSRAAYEAIDAANVSMLKHFARTAAHAREAMLHPPEPSAAMELGSHIHVAVLEPARFDSEFVLAPKCDRRTKEGKATWAAFEAENHGKTLLAADDYELVRAIRNAAWEHPTAAALLKGPGHCEVGAVWQHERTGLWCKGLIDRVGQHDGWTWIVDLKTCRDASPRGFARDVANLHYHAQAAYYVNGCNAIAPRPRRFAWIAVEKDAPHAVAVYEPDDPALLAGEARYEKWLDAYAEARESGVWPGYGTDVQSLSLPRWAEVEGEV